MSKTALTRRFTEQMVERLRPPEAGRVELGDEICPGLLLRVTERGVRSFSVIYKGRGRAFLTTAPASRCIRRRAGRSRLQSGHPGLRQGDMSGHPV